MKEVLLHICCGICSSAPVEKLLEEGFSVKGFFYNPNIHPYEEYLRRLEVAQTISKLLDFELIIGPYDDQKWFDLVKGQEEEPEGGGRCAVCFKLRLNQTFIQMKESGIPYFTTTLSVSPHKNSRMINEIGSLLSSENFLEYDFKKEDGFKNAMDFAGKHSLYRQNYCGCLYSRKQRERSK